VPSACDACLFAVSTIPRFHIHGQLVHHGKDARGFLVYIYG
jgi:hypothetical protein